MAEGVWGREGGRRATLCWAGPGEGGRGEGEAKDRWARGEGEGREGGGERRAMKRGLGVVETSWARHLIVEGERKKNYWKVDPREKGEGGGRRELGHVSGLWCFCISEWVCVAWCCTTQASCPYFIKVELVLWTLCIRIRSLFPWLISRLNDFTFLSNSSVTPFRMFQNWRLTLWYFPANGLPSLHLPSLHYLVTRPSPHASVCLNICN